MLSLEDAKADLRIWHDADDELLHRLIAAANAQALQFCNRHHWHGENHSAPHDVQQALMLLVRSMYEGTEHDQARRTAEVILMPHRRGMGI